MNGQQWFELPLEPVKLLEGSIGLLLPSEVIQGTCKDFSYSYREPSLVPHAEKAKVCWVRSV